VRYAQYAYAHASGLLRQIPLPLLSADEEEYQFDPLLLRMHDLRNLTLNHLYGHPTKFAPEHNVIDGAIVVAVVVVFGV
jgi:hypothetical protein